MTFLDNLYTQPFLKPKAQTYSEIRQTIELIYAEKQRSDCSTQILQSYLTVLLAQIQREIDQESSKSSPRKYVIIYKKLKQLIDQHYPDGLSASDYAAKLFLTQHHLNLVAKQVTGKTTSELIRARTVLEAKRLLTFSDYSISEIAVQLGYYDLSYFAKVFKQETNTAPLDFRKAISEKYRNL